MRIAGFVNLELVGEGGFADVFVGTSVATGQRVAVKVLRDAHIKEVRDNFAREARILGAKASRYLLSVLEAQLDGPQPHYVMPYMPAGPLTKCAGNLSDLDVLGYGTQIAHAVGSPHHIDLVHGDLKPDNPHLVPDRAADRAPSREGRGDTGRYGAPLWNPRTGPGASRTSSSRAHSRGYGQTTTAAT